MTIAIPVLTWVGHERRETERRILVHEELANLMERVTVRPWEELTTESLRQADLAAPLHEQLPGAELTADVSTPEGEPDARRIRLELRWPARPNGRTAAARLTAWTYRSERTE